MKTTPLAFATLAVLLLAVSGCGQRTAIEWPGEVTLRGEPVAVGDAAPDYDAAIKAVGS